MSQPSSINHNLLILPNSNSNSTVPSTCSSTSHHSNSSTSSPLQIPSNLNLQPTSIKSSSSSSNHQSHPQEPNRMNLNLDHSLLTNNLTTIHDNHDDSPTVTDWLEGTTTTSNHLLNTSIHSSPPFEILDPLNQLSLHSTSLTPRQASIKLDLDQSTIHLNQQEPTLAHQNHQQDTLQEETDQQANLIKAETNQQDTLQEEPNQQDTLQEETNPQDTLMPVIKTPIAKHIQQSNPLESEPIYHHLLTSDPNSIHTLNESKIIINPINQPILQSIINPNHQTPTPNLHTTFASPTRTSSPKSHSALGSHAPKLAPTTKLDVATKPAEAQTKSQLQPERKSVFGKLFEKRAHSGDLKVESKGGIGGHSTSVEGGNSGNESGESNPKKSTILGRKTSDKRSDGGGSNYGAETGNSMMGFLSRQASSHSAAGLTLGNKSNGTQNNSKVMSEGINGTKKVTATEGLASKLLNASVRAPPNEKVTNPEEKVVVLSSSSKLREMVGGKLGRKSSSSSKGARSEDGKSESQAGTSTLLKKYGVCEKAAIGKGATAVVRLAHKWDRGTDKLYAVKEFRKRRKNESEKEYVKKLTSEFCISSTLHHENIVETVDLVQDENQHWCEVMEYCPGGDLYAAIKRGSMNQLEIHSYFKQILLGVDYLHRMGVAHRDIKPENLLLDGKGKIKITDFGVSDVFRMCWEKSTHLSKGLCGSEPYLPKEMFERKEYDARLVDVWACGIVFYCCCMQELPWRVAKKNDPSFQIYLQAFESGSNSPPPISNLIKESRLIIKKIWSPEPEDRVYIEDVLKDSWVNSLEVL